jgi:hypothetical protein
LLSRRGVVALVAFVLGEHLTTMQWVGFGLRRVATVLITGRKRRQPLAFAPPGRELPGLQVPPGMKRLNPPVAQFPPYLQYDAMPL